MKGSLLSSSNSLAERRPSTSILAIPTTQEDLTQYQSVVLADGQHVTALVVDDRAANREVLVGLLVL
jgi:chemotaxis protein histidine kinase CheA